MGQWDKASSILLSASQEKGEGKGSNVEAALEGVSVSSRNQPTLKHTCCALNRTVLLRVLLTFDLHGFSIDSQSVCAPHSTYKNPGMFILWGVGRLYRFTHVRWSYVNTPAVR